MKDNTQQYQPSDDEIKAFENEVMTNKSNLIILVDMKKFAGISKKNMIVDLKKTDEENNEENSLF
jgi:hypothetical protein